MNCRTCALRWRLRMPEPGADEAFAGFQVDVERRRRDLAPARMEQARTLPALVRRLVVGEPRVAVEAEQRAADWPRIGAEMLADLREGGLQVREQAQEWPADMRFVIGLVRLEPRAFVVARQRAQEPEAPVAEIAVTAGCSLQAGFDVARPGVELVEQRELAAVAGMLQRAVVASSSR